MQHIAPFVISQHTFDVLRFFLHSLQVPFTTYYLKKYLAVSPDSLQSLTSLFARYKLASLITHIDVTVLPDIPYPALVQYNNGAFAVLEKLEGDSLSIFDGEKNNHNLSISEFKKLWSGVTLLIEKNENSAEPNYRENKKQEII